jgi:hypothetical protein
MYENTLGLLLSSETVAVKDWLVAQAGAQWRNSAADMLRRYERHLAIGKLAEALQVAAWAEASMLRGLPATLLSRSLGRVDFFSIALSFLQQAEAADPSLMRRRENEPPHSGYSVGSFM